MSKPFQSLARVWHDADARAGAIYVIGRPGIPDAGYGSKTLLKLFKEAGERIGIARVDLVLHTMRHSCVTTLLSRNVPPFMVAGFVDDDIRTIMDWYAHLGLDKPYVGAEGDAVPIRNPLEALAMRDRGPMLAKEHRLAKEAEEKAAAASERARQARRDRRLAKPSEGTRRAAASESLARPPRKRRS